MTFNSNSVLLNKGINHRVYVEIPSSLNSYKISEEVWKEAIKGFNNKLSTRSNVSQQIGSIKIDIICLDRFLGTVLWICSQKEDEDIIKSLRFILKGEVIFKEGSEEEVDKMVIEDILFRKGEGFFSEKI